MEAKQVKADLKLIGDSVNQSDGVPDSIKFLFREVLAWNESLADHTIALETRVASAEAALDELIEGGGELIYPETAAHLMSAVSHGQLLSETMAALIEGVASSVLDDVAKKRFAVLLATANQSFAQATQVINELVGEEDVDGDRDGDGDGADGADEDEEEEGDDADER